MEVRGIRKKLLKKIHVNQHNIRKNSKEGCELPVMTVKAKGKVFTGHLVTIEGASFLTYGKKALSCGAKVWIETYARVKIITYGKETVIIE